MNLLKTRETNIEMVNEVRLTTHSSPRSTRLLYKENGSVYTPETLALYVAHKLFEYMLKHEEKIKSKQKTFSVLDPACGDGELLAAAQKAKPNGIKLRLIGIDINKSAIDKAKARLNDSSSFVNTNGLCPFNKPNGSGWNALKTKLHLTDGVDCVIANPPWGANTAKYAQLIKESKFTLNEGQVDTSDLFIEASLKVVKNHGFIAFIIPDSLFYQERLKLREFLLKKTRIHFIGRFGEKIFKDINRACAIIICQKDDDITGQVVDCFRLTPEDRKLILCGKKKFSESEAALLHTVEQDRFIKNIGLSFNIDLDNTLEKTFNKISSQKCSLKDYLVSSRGVELSKKGMIAQCDRCKDWLPTPKTEIFICKQCQNSLALKTAKQKCIINNEPSKNKKSLLVGEHIQRYRSNPTLWIESNIKGINYKSDSLYKGTKIVVRKTGIGISSTVDYTGSYTNQVVYIFKLKNNINDIPIELFQSIIASRAIYFYISMMNGENEWKSHPYVTQAQVLEIPVPDIQNMDRELRSRVAKICAQLREMLENGRRMTDPFDAKIERLVADIYRLTKSDYKSIYTAIEKSQDLLPVRSLKNISIEDIF